MHPAVPSAAGRHTRKYRDGQHSAKQTIGKHTSQKAAIETSQARSVNAKTCDVLTAAVACRRYMFAFITRV